MVSVFGACSPIFSKHVFLVPVLDPHLTTYPSNIGVQILGVLDLGTSTLCSGESFSDLLLFRSGKDKGWLNTDASWLELPAHKLQNLEPFEGISASKYPGNQRSVIHKGQQCHQIRNFWTVTNKLFSIFWIESSNSTFVCCLEHDLACVWSWLFCIWHLPCLVSFWWVLGGSVEIWMNISYRVKVILACQEVLKWV